MAKAEDYMNHEGRLFDGWAYSVLYGDGSVERFHDHDAPPAILARWLLAKTGTGMAGLLTFSGAKSEAESRVERAGVIEAKVVSGIQLDRSLDREVIAEKQAILDLVASQEGGDEGGDDEDEDLVSDDDNDDEGLVPAESELEAGFKS